MRRLNPLVAWVAFVVIGRSVIASPAAAREGPAAAPIDPAVVAELDAGREATFWVVLREQADLDAAFAIRDWDDRGHFVYERLRATAESSQREVHVLLGDWGAEARHFFIVNAIEVRTRQRALPALLAARPEVAVIVAPPAVGLIEGATEVEGPPPQPVEWNIERIRAPLVWSTFGARGEGVVIGSIDSGVQYDHPALVEQYRGNLGGGVFDHNYAWYDPNLTCGSPPTEPCDSYWHGTAPTGVAVGDDGGGNRIGVAPGACFIMAAVNWSNSSLLAAMEWMLAPTDLAGSNPRPDLRPHVVNNSWVTHDPLSARRSGMAGCRHLPGLRRRELWPSLPDDPLSRRLPRELCRWRLRVRRHDHELHEPGTVGL